jgi:DNA invertase Pin-like site-specific DNA recombinase
MTGAELLPAAILQRKTVVYVRQSTQAQVETNLESQRRQYELVDVARRRGFRSVEVIDDDLGRSASGMVARPGFERLVASLCAGEVGAVLCFDASRLARNGRDWAPPSRALRAGRGAGDRSRWRLRPLPTRCCSG